MKKLFYTLFLILMTFCAYSQGNIRVTSMTSYSEPVSEGEQITISTDFLNNGNADVPSFQVYYYLNNVPVLDGNEIPLNNSSGRNQDTVSSLGPGDEDDENHYASIPTGLSSGTYYVLRHLVVAQANPNVRSKPITISGSNDYRDLIPINLSLSETEIELGGTIQISNQVQNIGTIPSFGGSFQLYMSDNDSFEFTEDQPLITTEPVPSLNPNQISPVFFNSITFPENIIGTKYILCRVDVHGQVFESNENNNVMAVELNIIDPNQDTDGDGVIDTEDDCPTEAGSQDNGCPTPAFIEFVDLKVKRQINGNEQTIYDYDPNGVNTPPNLGHSADFLFELTLKNSGETSSGDFTNLGIVYRYEGRYYPNQIYDFTQLGGEYSIISLEPNEERTIVFADYIWPPSGNQPANIGTFDLIPGDDYVITFVIDQNQLYEGSEFIHLDWVYSGNPQTRTSVTVSPNPTVDFLIVNSEGLDLSESSFLVTNTNAPLNQPQLVQRVFINSSKEAKLDVSSLSRGLYTLTIIQNEISGNSKPTSVSFYKN